MTFRVADDQRYVVTECWSADNVGVWRLTSIKPGTAVRFSSTAVIDCCDLKGHPLTVGSKFKIGAPMYIGVIEADLGVMPERRCLLLVEGGIRARVRVDQLYRP